jgi:hypothetical protein
VEARLKNGRAADEGLLFELTRPRSSTRGSADSEATAVSHSLVSPDAKPTFLKARSINELEICVTAAQYKDVSIATDSPPFDVVAPRAVPAGARPGLWPEWLESLIASPESTAYMRQSDHTSHNIFGRERRPSTPRRDALKNILTGRKKEEAVAQKSDEKKLGKLELDVMAKNATGSGSWGFKTWLKKKISLDHRPLRFDVIIDIDEEKCAVGREVKTDPLIPQKLDEEDASAKLPLDPTLRAYLIALIAASRDLGSIEECVTAVSNAR